MKTVWITLLDKNEELAKELSQTATRYGLTPSGHFWADDLKGMAWAEVLPEMAKANAGLWLIHATPERLAAPSVRQGLSLLALAIQAARGHGFPILLLADGEMDAASLPTPLAGAEIVARGAGLGPKLAAKANMPAPKIAADYRLDVHPMPGLGLWLEVGPGAGNSWSGALLGIDAGEITAHGVGPAGQVPERAVLEYPVRGLKLAAGDTEFTAWGLHNALSEANSYYVQIAGAPGRLLFGPMPGEGDDSPELRSLVLG